VRAFFILAHQARISCHIGGQDRGEAAQKGLFVRRKVRPTKAYLETRGGPSVEIGPVLVPATEGGCRTVAAAVADRVAGGPLRT
jgi:hypothetical protein